MATLLVACDAQYYTKPVNDAADPIVEDLLVSSNVGSDELTSDEAAAFSYLVDPTKPEPAGGFEVFSWSTPIFRVNKLLDGTTVEIVEKNPDTGADQSFCKMVDGAFSVLAGTTAVTPIRACYNPGTLVVTVQPSDDANDPIPYLAYDTVYSYTATAEIKDKHGKTMAPRTVKFHTAPFEVLTVMDGGSNVVLYGDGPFAAADTLEIDEGAETSGKLRILFSGPVHGDDALASFSGATGITGAELTKADGSSVSTDAAVVTKFVYELDEETTLAGDARILYVVTPIYQQSEGKMGLPPGDYTLTLPAAAVTDDGSVTGSPVHLAKDVVVNFSVVAAAAAKR